MGVVNSLKTLASMVVREKDFLVSNDNRIAAGALTDRTGAPATEGALYPPGWLHHHVVTRRAVSNSRHGGPRRDGRLVLNVQAFDNLRAAVRRPRTLTLSALH